MSGTVTLPPSLDLPPHLAAHKYFMVCTLTVAAWDTLVLSPRTWRLLKTKEWPVLKILFHFMRVFMPIEFTIVGVAFFDTKFSQSSCEKFFLFEPICTAILLAAASAVHVVRIHAIYDKSKAVLGGMSALFAVQIVVTAICCGFYRSTPLEEGQGCIASPKSNWVGIYWLAPTLLYTASFVLALRKSFNSLEVKPIGLWKLMLRDGLNLYGAVWIVNMVNMLFWFIMKPTGIEDPVKTIVTSMAAVLTTSMTLRIILSVRGTLAKGGSFALSHPSSHTHSNNTNSHSRNLSSSSRSGPHTLDRAAHTFTLDRINPQQEPGEEKKIGVVGLDGAHDAKVRGVGYDDDDSMPIGVGREDGDLGVKITVDKEVEYAGFPRSK